MKLQPTVASHGASSQAQADDEWARGESGQWNSSLGQSLASRSICAQRIILVTARCHRFDHSPSNTIWGGYDNQNPKRNHLGRVCPLDYIVPTPSVSLPMLCPSHLSRTCSQPRWTRLGALGLWLLAPLAAQDLPTPRAGLAPLGAKPTETFVHTGSDQRAALIRFVDGSAVSIHQGKLESPFGEAQAAIAMLEQMGASVRPLLSQPPGFLHRWRKRAERDSGMPLHDLTLFYILHFPQTQELGQQCDALNRLPAVGLCWPAGAVSDPIAAASPPPSPDLSPRQWYRSPAPLGVDAEFGNTYSGGLGTGFTIADVETGWTDDHEDIAHKAMGNYIGLGGAPYPWDHGTAVLGELVGEHQSQGVRGIVYDADVLLSTHQGFAFNVPAAIVNAAAALVSGDALLLEVQCQDAPIGPHPCEWDDAIFATVQLATASGIHVFAAGGNGGLDLDDPAFAGRFDRTQRDSGAIIVGASSGPALQAASFSNFGSRVDLHGWGQSVVSAGYGDLYNSGVLGTYTGQFSGTSSATPIVAGAGLQVAGIHRSVSGLDLSPLALRSLLTATGTPVTAGPAIGPRPDVRAAVEALGFPTLAVSGNLIPGGSYTATSQGVPGDGCVMIFGTAMADVNPLAVPPYGYFMLSGSLQRKHSGALDASGQLSYSEAIPPDASLAGTTLGYMLTWQRFLSGQPGTGAFGNTAAIQIQ